MDKADLHVIEIQPDVISCTPVHSTGCSEVTPRQAAAVVADGSQIVQRLLLVKQSCCTAAGCLQVEAICPWLYRRRILHSLCSRECCVSLQHCHLVLRDHSSHDLKHVESFQHFLLACQHRLAFESRLDEDTKPVAAEKRLRWKMSTGGSFASCSCLVTAWHCLQ